jgi:hypothetical protein
MWYIFLIVFDCKFMSVISKGAYLSNAFDDYTYMIFRRWRILSWTIIGKFQKYNSSLRLGQHPKQG